MNIILIGFKGCGKTLIGKMLANRLKREFYDTDSVIESIYAEEAKSSLPFREIYKKHGSEYFRNLEKKALKKAKEIENSIISLGGGTIFSDYVVRGIHPVDGSQQIGRRISDLGYIIYLHVEPDVLYERIIKNGVPAFFDSLNPRQSFDKLYAERLPLYKRFADIVIDNSRGVEETINNILTELKKENIVSPQRTQRTQREK